MDLISREAIMKLTKEMYLEIANTEYDVHTISDCTSYVASKCRQYIDERIQRKNIPSAFEEMTNGEVITNIIPNIKTNEDKGYALIHCWIDSVIDGSTEVSMVCRREWWNAPYQKGGE